MNTYEELQQKVGERIYAFASLKVAAASIIRNTVNECIDVHGFPADIFTFLGPNEPHSIEESVTRDKIGEKVSITENGHWGCTVFVRIRQTGRGEITVHLKPEISFGTELATLRLLDYPEGHCIYDEKNKAAGIREYARAWIRHLLKIIDDLDGVLHF